MRRLRPFLHRVSPNAGSEAWWLVQHALSMSKQQLLTRTAAITRTEVSAACALVRRRVQRRTPLQYLLGHVPFCGMTLQVEPPILIPRPETEEWTEWVLDKTTKHANTADFNILDACTGSGCVALALASRLPEAAVFGIDEDPRAIALARRNQAACGVTNCNFATCAVEHMPTGFPPSWPRHFDLVVSNPPYVPDHRFQTLDPEVRLWERPSAVVAGMGGMEVYRALVDKLPLLIRPRLHLPFVLVCEVGGRAQAEKLSHWLAASPLQLQTDIHVDMWNRCRWISAAEVSPTGTP